jgi:hypothetical protein
MNKAGIFLRVLGIGVVRVVVLVNSTRHIVSLANIALAVRVDYDVYEKGHGGRCQRGNLAPAVGFEPTTKWLTATYSTAELCRNLKDEKFILLYSNQADSEFKRLNNKKHPV